MSNRITPSAAQDVTNEPGDHVTGQADEAEGMQGDVTGPAATLYGPSYYQSHCGPVPYARSAHWLGFFGGVADHLVNAFAPRRMFDAGCALGLLVECFWDRGVVAHGRDISPWAIGQVRADVRPYCTAGSIAEPIEGEYDLLTCIEVLEHMEEADALRAIRCMAAAAPRVLFSSSPTDLDEPTHCTVRPPIFWLQAWAEAGFAPSVTHDATYLAPHAFVLERSEQGRSPRDLAAFADRLRLRQTGAQLNHRLWEAEAALARSDAALSGERAAAAADAARLEGEAARLTAEVLRVREEGEARLAAELLRVSAEGEARLAAAAREADRVAGETRAAMAQRVAEDRQLRAVAAQRATEAREAEARARAETARVRVEADQARTGTIEVRAELERERATGQAAEGALRRTAAELARTEAEVARLRDALEMTEHDRRAVGAERDRVLMSTTWRATWPVRAAGKLLLPPPVRRSVRQGMSAAWWIATGKLGSRVQRRRDVLRQVAALSHSPQFDADWYYERNPDVAVSGLSPALHYVTIGAPEGRAPGPQGAKPQALQGAAAPVPALTSEVRPARPPEAAAQARQDELIPPAPSPPAPETPPAVAAASGEDPCEVIAREIFAEQQAELSREAAAQAIAGLAHRPLISVLMPVYGTPVQWLRRAVESLQEQYYGNWELCAVDDQSPGSEQRDALRDLAAADPRVRDAVMERNGGISAATNLALRMARGEYVALLDHDDELTPDALLRMVEAINREPEADFIYSDECKIDDTPARRLFHFIFKPDWSPEIMFNGMLTGHLTLYRRALVEQLGAFRSEYDFSQDYDLALRVAEAARRIVHVERVLYLWRAIPGSAATGAKFDARATNIAALDAALRRRGIAGQATPLAFANCVRIAVPADETRVSIIIPSDSLQNLRAVLQAIRVGTDYPNYEVVVVCNGPLAAQLREEFFDWDALIFKPYDRPYNFSDKCNEGARVATGDVLVFYNDDVFPLQGDWVERLVEYLWVDGVGGTSPKLLHADDTIQYAGMISGTPGLCGTAYNNVPRDAPDSFLTMHQYVRNVSILSGACCALRKTVFWQVGGFDAVHTPDAHSDLDLSYKLIEAGLRCVYTPHAVLRHIGNHSWGARRRKSRADAFMLQRWGSHVSHDPFFTASMKRVLYRDFTFRYRVHAEHLDPQRVADGPHVVFVSHELSLTGAPRMLLYAARVVLEAGGFPVIVAPEDGPLRQEITSAGIATILDASLQQGHFLFERFACNFDLAVVNTIELSPVVRQLSAIGNLQTAWWLHEARSLASDLQAVSGVQWSRVRVLCNGAYARQFVPDGIDAKILHYGIPDTAPSNEEPRTGKPTTFLLSGTIEPRKGQDIFVDAIALLPDHVRRQCRFVMTGKVWKRWQPFWQETEHKMAHLPEVTYLGLCDHREQLRLIGEADVVVCASRDEPWSLVVTEGAMLRRPSILNEHVGAAEVFDDASCLRFECGSAPSLSRQLLAAHERRDELPEMGRAARRVFEGELTLAAFGTRFLAMVEQQAAGSLPHVPATARRHRTQA